MSNVLEMLAYWKNKTQSPRWRFLRSNEAASKRLSPDRTTLVPDRKRPTPITCGNLKTMCLEKKGGRTRAPFLKPVSRSTVGRRL